MVFLDESGGNETLRKWEHWLWGRKIRVLTDHKPLSYLDSSERLCMSYEVPYDTLAHGNRTVTSIHTRQQVKYIVKFGTSWYWVRVGQGMSW